MIEMLRTKSLTQLMAPQRLSDVIGNEEALMEIRKWSLQVEKGVVQPLLLWGPPGTGKTAIAHALANERGWSLVEVSASDLRSAESLRRLIGLAHATIGLFGERRLILVDDVDSVFDEGEILTLVELIKGAVQPFILTAGDAWSAQIAPLRILCKSLELRRVNAQAVARFLIRACERVGGECSRALINEIAARSGGDVRAALIDLEVVLVGDGQALVTGERDRGERIWSVVRGVLRAGCLSDALAVSARSDVDLETLVEWLRENAARELSGCALVKAFEALSRSDVFAARCARTRAWRLKRYQRALALSLSLGAVGGEWIAYGSPTSLKLLALTRQARSVLDSALSKCASLWHCSRRKLRQQLCLVARVATCCEAIGLSDEERALLSHFSR